jgi:hypothetical protein
MKLATVVDSQFGPLQQKFDALWVGSYEIVHFDKMKRIALNVMIDRVAGINENQRIAFQHLQKNSKAIYAQSELEITAYAKKFGVEGQMVMSSIEPVAFHFPDVCYEPTFGILYDVSWDPEHGAAVRFVNGEFVEVGQQDIVL